MMRITERFALYGIGACFLLSGFSALLYQTAWMRQISVVFGTSELAVATVLAAYMGGLALGAWLAGRYLHRITRPVLFYGVLEAAIGLSALAVPWLLKLAGLGYVWLLGGQESLPDASGPGQGLFYLAATFAVLCIPTACMGATLPMLSRYAVRADSQLGTRIGQLYAVNTAGAVAGTLAAAFLLLPTLGLFGTVVVGGAVNLLVFAIAAVIAIGVDDAAVGDDVEVPAPVLDAGTGQRAGLHWILPLILFSGVLSFVYEVLWTRLLSHVLGGSLVAFASMLASFLAGIAIGSYIAARLAGDRQSAWRGFVLCQLGIAVTSALIYELLPLIALPWAGLGRNWTLAVMVLMPATLFIGATFPFAVRLLARSAADAGPASARVYSWNTLGAILGAVGAGFFLVPLLQYEGVIRWAVCLNLALAFLTCVLLAPQRHRLHYRVWGGATALAMVVGLVLYRPAWPEDILRRSPLSFGSIDAELRFYGVGRSATVLLFEREDRFYLRTNGLPEAAPRRKGEKFVRLPGQQVLSTLPVLARPDARDMLVVGLGGGVVIENLAPTLQRVDVLELEPEVLRANRAIAAQRNIDPLADPRVAISINDARNALQLTDARYDAIVSQPSHPWTAGASHLYTREFMSLASEHLRDGGVFLQWMNVSFVDASLLKALCATLMDVFAHVRVYSWSSEVLFFLASDAPLDMERQIALTGRPLDDRQHYGAKGIDALEDVLATLLLDEEGVRAFSAGGDLLTDNRNRMAMESAHLRETLQTLGYGKRWPGAIAEHNPLLRPDSWVYSDFPVELDFERIASRMCELGTAQFIEPMARLLERRGDLQVARTIARTHRVSLDGDEPADPVCETEEEDDTDPAPTDDN